MARPLRLEFPHAVYHVTSRGNARQKIVRTDIDRQAFLAALALVVDRFSWRCHAYCLMDNHYHLLIETPLPNLSLGMRQLNGPYTQSFNRRHRRVGHLFQGRFKAILVEKDAHLLELCRYVVLNPVRAKLFKRPERWAWSSYRATAGQSAVPAFLTVTWILEQFASRLRVAQQRYQAFVMDGIGGEGPWDQLRGQLYLGSDTFVARHQPARVINEISRRQTHAHRATLATLFARKERQDDKIAIAYRQHGYRLREIAEYLGIHYATVSRHLRRAEQAND
jgi:REP element-mobilizing transposase RayT